MLHDPHADKRKEVESCLTCRFFFPSPKCLETGGKGKHVTGDCRRFPPNGNYNGHQTVYVQGWCGEYKSDEQKHEHLKVLEAAEAKRLEVEAKAEKARKEQEAHDKEVAEKAEAKRRKEESAAEAEKKRLEDEATERERQAKEEKPESEEVETEEAQEK